MIAFRVDANEKIATGHLMRCIAIATECKKRGQECLFLLAEEKETHRLTEYGFQYHILNSSWDALEEELPILQHFLQEKSCDWLVVDSYQATAYYLQILNKMIPVLYLDDMGVEQYDVTAILRYGLSAELNQYADRYRRKGVTVLAGPPYIPLREEFQPDYLLPLKQRIRDREKAILITTGGTDPYNVTGKTLELCLMQKKLQGYRYHVIVGSMNEHAGKLQQLAERIATGRESTSEILLYSSVGNMSEMMCQCDFAVSAGGTTLYELCACEIPTVCFSFADNQVEGVQQLNEYQVMKYAGDARKTDVASQICRRLLEYICHPEDVMRYKNRMKDLVDGKGVYRIADILCR